MTKIYSCARHAQNDNMSTYTVFLMPSKASSISSKGKESHHQVLPVLVRELLLHAANKQMVAQGSESSQLF